PGCSRARSSRIHSMLCASAGEILPGDGSDSPSPTRFLRDTFRSVTRPRTIANLWLDAMQAAHPAPAYLHLADDEWREMGWDEAATAVDELANGLLALGVGRGDAFAILARTTLEWALFDFALALVGAVGAPVYSNSSQRDVAY